MPSKLRTALTLALLVVVMIGAHTLGMRVAEAATDTVATEPDAGTLLLELYRAVAIGSWFPAAGAALSLSVIGARWLLGKRWPALLVSDLWGVAITAGLAGFGALGHAWLADADIGATTLIGALKVWGFAVATFVTAKKLKAPTKPAATAALVTLVMLAGCPGPGPGPVIADSVIDCLGETRPRIDALIVELSPLVFLSSPDWSAVYQRAKAAGKELGGCVIAEIVQKYLAPAPGRMAPSTAESWRAHEILETYRKNEVGGASFKTAAGNL